MPDAFELVAAFAPFAGTGAERGRRYALLDVFTDTPLAGNQLAVFTDARGLSATTMQQIARELNISESVFVFPREHDGDVRIRIFTPGAELPFAGHPVLGAAVVVGAALRQPQVVLETAAAAVPVRLERVGERLSSGWMRQPIPTWSAFAPERELLAALGVERSRLPVEVYDNGPRHVYVALAGEAEVAALRPDLRALAALGEIGVSCFAVAGGQCRTRMFAPALGVPEDPATGSAAGPLAVHLSRHGEIAFGAEIEIRQGQEIARPSLLRARALGSAQAIEAVEVGGSVVLLARAELFLG